MEIIHLILGKANPDRMNGVNQVVYQLASRQAASGRQVSVWGISADTSHNYGQRNFETRLFRASRYAFSIPVNLKSEMLAMKDKAVFHLHGGWIPVYSSLGRFMNRTGIHFVLTGHGAYNAVAMQRSRLQKWFYFQVKEKSLLKRAQRIHSIGESEEKGLKNIFPEVNSFLLPYGFEMAAGQPLDSPKDKPFTLGFLGRVDVHTKGLDLLAKAFRGFKELIPDSQLWIIGDGDDRLKLEEILGDQTGVRLWGGKFGAEKRELLQQLDLYVQPSRNEGLPASALEASNLGIPLLVSEATNLGRYVRSYKAGIVVPNQDSEALLEGMVKMHQCWSKSQLDWERMSINARSMVKEAFDWNRIVDAFDELYMP